MNCVRKSQNRFWSLLGIIMEFASVTLRTRSNVRQYRLRLPVYISGTYRLQVVVIHSNIELKGIEPFRNYILWDRLHNLSAQTPNQIFLDTENDSLETWHNAGGWMRTTGESRLGLHSAQALVAQQWNGESYRCPANATASFTSQMGGSFWGTELSRTLVQLVL